jgi:RNA polymerase sigma factor (sigma-70 family)
MAVDSSNALARHLRAANSSDAGATDGQLLDRFAADRDGGAFAELVRRHGPMVLGVCRRITGNVHDAEDAFQATFLVLARKARELSNGTVLGAWLHGVAHRSARKARAVAARRRAKEVAAARFEGVEEMAEPSDALAVIEQELGRLPKRYREPLVLCGLCGRSRAEVASELGVPEGTLASRLATARAKLAERLRRRGLVVPAAVAAVTGEVPAVRAAVPGSLAEATGRAATGTVPATVGRIASEVAKSMFLNKLRMVVLLAVGAVACAAGLVALSDANASAPAPDRPLTPAAPRPVAPDKPAEISVKELQEKVKAAKKDLQGTWELQKQIFDDKELEFQFEYHRYTFAEHTVKIEYKHNRRVGRVEIEFDEELNYTINPTTAPPEMTLYGKSMLAMGLYDLKNDTLKIAHYGISELERPRGFALADKRVSDMPLMVWEFKRKK